MQANLSDIIQVTGGQRSAVTITRANTSPMLKRTQIRRGQTDHNKSDAECQLPRKTNGQTGQSATGKVVKFNTI